MENLIVPPVPDAPYFPTIMFDAGTGICEISGESYMEETYLFYRAPLDWLDSYFATGKKLVFNFKLIYFNTSTSRVVLGILDKLKEHKDKGGNVDVNWYYRKDDPDMLDEVEDFMDETGCNINLIPM